MSHTPGPWTYTTSPRGWTYDIHQADNAKYTHGSSDVGILFVTTIECDSRFIQEANARLIASAPELLAELQRYLLVIEHLESKPELWEEIAYPLGIATANGYRHVIAKATGEIA